MANDNGEGGVWLDNSNLSAQPITITGYGIFNNNGSAHTGLYIQSQGHVKLANITANNNGDYGVFIDVNNTVKPTAFSDVTITGMNTFNNNGVNGLYILNDGTITLSNITANYNDEEGVYLDNSLYQSSGPAKNLIISGINQFSHNQSTGLYFDISGAVSLKNITANYNNDPSIETADGVQGTSNGNITLACGSFYSNESYGYNFTVSPGKIISIKGLFSFGNSQRDSATGATPIITCAGC